MRNLFAFLQRFQVFLIFLIFQGLALYYYVSTSNFPKSVWLTGTSVVVAKMNGTRNEINKQLNLNNTNIRLQRENAKLRRQLEDSKIKISNGEVTIDDTSFQQNYTYTPGLIINSSFEKRNNYFTVNVGKFDGIEVGMGVISDKGIVGVIFSVNDHFSMIRSVLTEEINIDVMVQKNGAFGLLKWDGRNPRFGNIKGISNDMKLQKWMTIVTRGGSGIFPRNIPVGKIAKISPVQDQPLWDIKVLFSENYRKIQRVYVVKNLLLREQKKLESQTPKEKDE